jgi:hypothetical protein
MPPGRLHPSGGQREGIAMRTFVVKAFAMLACLTAGGICAAQDQPEPPKPVFPQLFPRPTGQNGYEELVMAGDLARAAETRREFFGTEIKLSEMRARLNEPDCRRALELLRQGLAKPIFSPRREINFNTTFPEFATLRCLARLLGVAIYVQFANGNTGEAVQSLRDGLNLGYMLQGETLIGSLVGIAIDAIALRGFANHLDQLSARDCDRLIEMARERLRRPDTTLATMTGEYRGILNSIEEYRKNPRAALEMFRESWGEDADKIEQQYAPLIQSYLNNPAAAAQLTNEVSTRVSQQFDNLMADLRLPPWQRKGVEIKPDGTIAGYVAEMFTSVFAQATRKFTYEQAQVQLLGVHAAIRRSLWENQRLPDSLEELKLGALATDPFTGKTLKYKVTGKKSYELYSAGPVYAGQERPEPIYLPYRPKE